MVNFHKKGVLKTLKKIWFCITCADKISFNINNAQCQSCLTGTKDGNNYPVKGKFCHSCGIESTRITSHKPICIDCRPFDLVDNSVDDYYNLWVQKYNSMSSTKKRQISPVWDCESTEIKLGLDYYSLKECRTVDLVRIVSRTSSLNTTNIFDNEPKSNKRIMNIIRAWSQQTLLRPPTIIDQHGQHVYDGHHRILATYFLESEHIMMYERLH